MRLRSRGLGRKELVMDFREYDAIREGKEIVVVGTIRDPITWDFSIRMCEDDLPGMSKLLLNKAVLGFAMRAFFKPKTKTDHHWTGDRPEHLAQGKEFLMEAITKAKERKQAYEEALEELAMAEAAAADSTVQEV
jgi:hypothetical protein